MTVIKGESEMLPYFIFCHKHTYDDLNFYQLVVI